MRYCPQGSLVWTGGSHCTRGGTATVTALGSTGDADADADGAGGAGAAAAADVRIDREDFVVDYVEDEDEEAPLLGGGEGEEEQAVVETLSSKLSSLLSWSTLPSKGDTDASG